WMVLQGDMVGDRQDGTAVAAPSDKKLGKITSTKVGSIYPTLTLSWAQHQHGGQFQSAFHDECARVAIDRPQQSSQRLRFDDGCVVLHNGLLQRVTDVLTWVAQIPAFRNGEAEHPRTVLAQPMCGLQGVVTLHSTAGLEHRLGCDVFKQHVPKAGEGMQLEAPDDLGTVGIHPLALFHRKPSARYFFEAADGGLAGLAPAGCLLERLALLLGRVPWSFVISCGTQHSQ
ncbi:hypothetical protein LGM31_34600, partial [Burkholderia vietnamiensis]